MSKPIFLAASLATIIGLGATAQSLAQDVAHPDPVTAVLARQAQMEAMQVLAFHIQYEAEEADEATLFRLSEEGMALTGMMQAVPLLFAPGTAPADLPEDAPVQSQADPAIWQNWEEFQALAADAQVAAEGLAAALDSEAMLTAVAALNDTCSACHDRFLVYQSPF